jgi:hypothetical protein
MPFAFTRGSNVGARSQISGGIMFTLKVHKIENFFYSDFGICVISLLVMHK